MRTEPIADFITVSVSSMLNSSTAVSEVLLSVVIVLWLEALLCLLLSNVVVKKEKRRREGGEETSVRLVFHQVGCLRNLTPQNTNTNTLEIIQQTTTNTRNNNTK